jgi:hypothetical protein
MVKVNLAGLVVLASVFVGCGSLYRVKGFDSKNPAGIPFFAKSGACTQETVYANPYFLITLKVSGASGVIFSDTAKLSNTGHSSADFNNLIKELDKPQPDLSSVQTAWALLKQRQSFDPYTQSDGEFLLSNAAKIIAIVDYSHPYALNQRKPLAGSVSADYKISSDGTLAEAQGQVQDNTLSTILSALPLSDLIKSAAGIAAKAGAAAAQPPESVHMTLEQEERIRTKTYSVTTKYKEYCSAGTAMTSATPDVSTSLSDIGSSDISAKKDVIKNDSAIGISGTISLPKALLPHATNANESGKPASSNTQGSVSNNKATTTK